MVLGCSVGWFWGSPWVVLGCFCPWCRGTVPMSSGTTEASWKMLPQREQLWAGGTPRKRTRCSPTWGDRMDLSPGHEDFPALFDVLRNEASGEGRLGCPGTAPCWGLLEHLQVGAGGAHCLLRGTQQWVPPSQLTTGTFRRNLCSAAWRLRAKHTASVPWHPVHPALYTEG